MLTHDVQLAPQVSFSRGLRSVPQLRLENAYRMKHAELIRRLGVEGEGAAEAMLVLLLRSAELREILDEYALVIDAFDHWSNTKGKNSSEALQYKQLVEDRSEEIKAFIPSQKTPPAT